jgi:hypothetical protein
LTHFERGHSIAATTSSFSGDAIRQIIRTFPFDESRRGHHFIQDRKNIGKVVLTPYGLTKPPVARERKRGNHAGAYRTAESPAGRRERAERQHEDEYDRVANCGDLAALDNIGPM